MFEKFWEILKEKDNLLDRSKSLSLTMLITCREMLEMVNQAMREGGDEGIRETIRRTDRKINQQEREVRKMVFEHLSMSSSSDLLTGLQLLTMVIDIERIGDYIKNIADLVEMLPGKLDFGDYEEDFNYLEETTLKIFNTTITGLEENDAVRGEEVTMKYEEMAKVCDQKLKEMVTSESSDQLVEKRYIAMALIFRYMKRVNAHLKNLATVLVNPFHRIGFRPH